MGLDQTRIRPWLSFRFMGVWGISPRSDLTDPVARNDHKTRQVQIDQIEIFLVYLGVLDLSRPGSGRVQLSLLKRPVHRWIDLTLYSSLVE